MSDHNPVPYQAAYSGTKAFITNFANALHHELKNPNFSISVFAPGGVVTEMTGGEKFVPLKKYLMPVEDAARKGLRAFTKRKFRYVPGLVNQLSDFFGKFLPAKFLTGQVGKVYKKRVV